MGQKKETALLVLAIFSRLTKAFADALEPNQPWVTLFVTVWSNLAHCGSIVQRVIQVRAQAVAASHFTSYLQSVLKPLYEGYDDCPPPLTVMTFLYMHPYVHSCLREKLAVTESLLARQRLVEEEWSRVQRLSGFITEGELVFTGKV
jgi:hypothetical protein